MVGVVVCAVWLKAPQLPPAPFCATLTVAFVVVVMAEVVVEVVATVVRCVAAAGAVAVPEVLFVVVAVVVTLALVAEVAEAGVPGAKLRITLDAPSIRHPHLGLKAVTLVLPGSGFVLGTPHRPAPPHRPLCRTPKGCVRLLVNLKAECLK